MDKEDMNDVMQEKSNIEFAEKDKISKLQEVKKQISKMNLVVKNLENSLAESEQHDKQLVTALRMDNMKNQRLASQLEEARKENKQILNALQQQCHDNESSRSLNRSNLDLSSYSTMSMVNLQYKYEELMTSHEGLLKVLESRVKEVQNAYNENNVMRDEIENLTIKLSACERKLYEIRDKYVNLRARKDKKIRQLRTERNTLRAVHNQLVELLSKQCMEQDRFLSDQLQSTHEPVKALLLREVRKTNQLQHENSQLKQEVEYLRSQIDFIQNENQDNKIKNWLSHYKIFLFLKLQLLPGILIEIYSNVLV